jgi:hypothetical protein
MSDSAPWQLFNYRSDIEKAVRETRSAIQEALGYIDRQEDGPFTMRCALQEIDNRLSAIETEVCCLVGTTDRLQAIAMKLMEQRDEALRQRDLLIAVSGLREYGDQA